MLRTFGSGEKRMVKSPPAKPAATTEVTKEMPASKRRKTAHLILIYGGLFQLKYSVRFSKVN